MAQADYSTIWCQSEAVACANCPEARYTVN